MNALVMSHLHYWIILLNKTTNNQIFHLEKSMGWAVTTCCNRPTYELFRFERTNKTLQIRFPRLQIVMRFLKNSKKNIVRNKRLFVLRTVSYGRHINLEQHTSTFCCRERSNIPKISQNKNFYLTPGNVNFCSVGFH